MRKNPCCFLFTMIAPLALASCAPAEKPTVESIQTASQGLTTDKVWKSETAMNVARMGHVAVALNNGRLLVIGGTNDDTQAVEIFDPNSEDPEKKWTVLEKPPFTTSCSMGLANLRDNDHTVLAVAQESGTSTMTVWSFDAAGNLWTPIAPLSDVKCYSEIHIVPLRDEPRALILAHTQTNELKSFVYDAGNVTATPIQAPQIGGNWQFSAVIGFQTGEVLVSGSFESGMSGDLLHAEAILYDEDEPTTWVPAGNMFFSRLGHSAALLPGDRVLVVGGDDSAKSAEIFDLKTKTWTPTAPMLNPRNGLDKAATSLHTGLVLVTGGSASSTAEYFDSVTETWTSLESANDFRFRNHTATLLDDGNVLIAGGRTYDNGTSSAPYQSTNLVKRCDALALAWESLDTKELSFGGFHTTTKLDDDRLLVIGGAKFEKIIANEPPSITETYNAAFAFEQSDENNATPDTWTTVAAPGHEYALHTAAKLNDGRVLVAGGFSNPIFQIFDPSSGECPDAGTCTGKWTDAGTFHGPMIWSTLTPLLPADGRVLHVGGLHSDGNATSKAETYLYDPSKDEWMSRSELPIGHQLVGHTATLLQNGKILVVGGVAIDGLIQTPLRNAWLFDPAVADDANPWTQTKPMNIARMFHSATLLQDGRVLIAGGGEAEVNTKGHVIWTTIYASAEIYNPSSDAATSPWTSAGAMVEPRTEHQAVLLENGRVLVAGGRRNSEGRILASAEIFDPNEETWTTTSRLQSARYGHTLTLLSKGAVTVGGFHTFSGVNRPAERFPRIEQGKSCSTNAQCKSSICSDGVCCNETCSGRCVACSANGAVARGLGGTKDEEDGICEDVSTCKRYACQEDTGLCATSCSDVDDCASGYVCTPSKECIEAPPNTSTIDDSGCHATARDSSASSWASLAVIAAAYVARRRKPRRKS